MTKQEKRDTEFLALVARHLAAHYAAVGHVYAKELAQDTAEVRRKVRPQLNRRRLDYLDGMMALVAKSRRLGKYQAVFDHDNGLLVDVVPV